MDKSTAKAFTNKAYDAPDKRADVGGYKYDASLSNVDTGIWHNHEKKLTVVANRGSVTKTDWLVSDPHIAFGAEGASSRFKRAVKQTKQAHAKHNYNVIVVGHSLGGSLSNHTTMKLGANSWYLGSIGFNPGVSSVGKGFYFSKARRDCRKKKGKPAYCDKTTNHFNSGDPVSNKNLACDIATWGMGGKMCRKRVGYGKELHEDNRKKRTGLMKFVPRPMVVKQVEDALQHKMDRFAKDS